MNRIWNPVDYTILESKFGSQVSNGQVNVCRVNPGVVKRMAMQMLVTRD